MSTDGDAFAAGAAETARLAKDVQDLGFATARTIVERFVDMFAQFAGGGADAAGAGAGTGDAGTKPPFWLGGSDGSMRRRSSRTWRRPPTPTSPSWASSTRPASASSTPPAGGSPRSAEHDDLACPEVAPGGRSSARLWLHNTTRVDGVGPAAVVPRVGQSHRGRTPGDGRDVPARTDRSPGVGGEQRSPRDGRRREDAAPGPYHGQLLVDGLPDVVFPLRVRVQPATAGDPAPIVTTTAEHGADGRPDAIRGRRRRRPPQRFATEVEHPYLAAPMSDYPNRVGKALRPSLCLATCEAFGGPLADALPSALAIELLHNAFLVHDDIEDASLLRQGRAHAAPALRHAAGAERGRRTGAAGDRRRCARTSTCWAPGSPIAS